GAAAGACQHQQAPTVGHEVDQLRELPCALAAGKRLLLHRFASESACPPQRMYPIPAAARQAGPRRPLPRIALVDLGFRRSLDKSDARSCPRTRLGLWRPATMHYTPRVETGRFAVLPPLMLT